MPRIEPGKSRQAQFDPNTIMYPYPPNKKGKIDHWSADSNQTKPLWKNAKTKEPGPKKLGQQ